MPKKSIKQRIIETGRPLNLNKKDTYYLLDKNNAVVGYYKRKLTIISEQRRLQNYKGELKVLTKEEYVKQKKKK